MWPMMRRVEFGLDPFAELGRLHREVSRLYDGTRVTHKMDVRAHGDETLVTLEVPGLEPEQFDITVNGQTLLIQGEREPERLEESETVYRQERGHGRFSRTVQLPYEVDEQGMAARYEHGVLHIRLPRSEATKPRKIHVEA